MKDMRAQLEKASYASCCRVRNGPRNIVIDHTAVGRSKHWIKVKNRKHPAMERVLDSFR
jgi:hypothetical protein